MTRLLKLAAALLCALCGASALPAQMTTITAAANSLKIGGSVISTGTAVFTPVNVNGIAIAFSTGGGGLNSPSGFSCPITSGGLSGCSIPDASLSSPANLLYQIQISDTSTGNSSSGQSFTLQAVAGVAGSTWALDHYAPSVTVQYAGAMTYTQAVGPPTGTWAVNSFYADITNLMAPVLYTSVNGTMEPVFGQIIGGGNTLSSALTSNCLPKASGANSLVNSSICSDGTTTTFHDGIIQFGAGATFNAASLTFNGAYYFQRWNTGYWASGYPSTCVVNGITYNDKGSCAWYTAKYNVEQTAVSAMLNWGCETYGITTPGGLVAPVTTNGASLSQIGMCPASTRVYKSPGTILQAETGVTASALMSYPVAVGSLATPFSIDGVSIDANNITPSCWTIFDVGYSGRIDNMGCNNTAPQTAAGGFDFEFGNVAEAGADKSQENHMHNIVDNGYGNNEGPSASLTVNMSGNTIPAGTGSIVVNSPGNYGSPANLTLYLIGPGANGSYNMAPCTGGAYTISHSGSGITLVNVTASYTCTSPEVSAQIHETPTHDYGGILHTSDSDAAEFLMNGNFNVANVWVPFGSNHLSHFHIQTHGMLGALDNGHNVWDATEFDKVTFGIEITGPERSLAIPSFTR